MKFQVRDGFVVRLMTVVDLGDGKTETQENSYFGNQLVEMSAAQADEHAHKLEPKDRIATEYLAGKVLQSPNAVPTGITPEASALIAETAKRLVAAMLAAQSPAPAPASA